METGYRFGNGEIEAVLATDAETRYRYFIKRVADWEQVWGLRNADGWVLAAKDDGQQVALFWPFEAYAQRAAVEQWHDTEPTPIPLEAFMERWLPGLAGDERLVCVLPGVDGRGPVVPPMTLRDDIQDELDRLE